MDIDADRALRLFQAIVTQALEDAISEVGKPAKVSTKVSRRAGEGWCDWIVRRRATITDREAYAVVAEAKDRNDARHWLTKDMEAFPKIVSLAGYNPTDIRERARKLEAVGWPRPEKLREAA